MIRGLARLEAIEPNPVVPCIASHKKGKNTRWVHLNGDVRVRFDDGRTFTVPDAATVEFFENTHPTGAGLVPLDLARVRARLKQIDASVTSWKLACLGPQEQVWVEACATSDEELRGCAEHDGHVLLTPGGPSIRAQWLTGHAHGFVALGLLGMVLLLRITWGAASSGRTVIGRLAEQSAVPGAGTATGVVTALFSLGAFISLATWATTYGPWFLCAFVAGLAVLLVVSLLRRLRVLGAARRVLVETETSRLHGASHDANELAVHVAHDAPLVDGFRAGARHAAVQLSIEEGYAKRSGSKTVVAQKKVLRGAHPRFVPIEDASGRGVLDLNGCELDVPLEPAVQWKGAAATPAWVVERFGALEESQTHRYFVVGWRAVDPGEPLLIYGGVERVAPSAVGGEDVTVYRIAPEIPVVRSREGRTSIAHVGAEAPLLRAIGLERAVASAVMVLAVVASAASGWAFAWVLAQ